MNLYDRRCVVLIGREQAVGSFALEVPAALRVEGLRCTFKVTRDAKPEPNPLELSIFNLSPATRGELQGKGQRVIVLAGYDGATAQVFSGEVSRINHERNGPDWITKVLAGDGARAFRHARVNESYRPGTPVAQVIGRTVAALQADPGNALAVAGRISAQFSAGYAQQAPAAAELTRLLEPHGYTWSIQDGRVEVLAEGEALPDTGPLLSPETGLVGVPQLGSPSEKAQAPTLKARSLLQPALRPGQRFELQSESLRGTFRAVKVVHSGDTHSGDWYTEIEAVPA